jgi:hypothetical protein
MMATIPNSWGSTLREYNQCHDPGSGQFCSTAGSGSARLTRLGVGRVSVASGRLPAKAADEVADVLGTMAAEGYRMPRGVTVERTDRPYVWGEWRKNALIVRLPESFGDEADLDAEVARAWACAEGEPRRAVATRFRDVVVHEMGHALQTTEGPDGFARTLAAVKAYESVAGRVSQYAVKDPGEFVAETFTALYAGETVAPDILAIYRDLGGPAIRRPR